MSKRNRQKFEETHRSARKFFRESEYSSSVNDSLYEKNDAPVYKAAKRMKLADDLREYIVRNVYNGNEQKVDPPIHVN